jgi:hypothetical protein
MPYEHSAPKSPLCPSCAQNMRLAGITSRFDDLPDLYTFECRACGVSHIEAAPLAVNLEAEGNRSSEKASSPALFSKLDVLEGSQLFRACRKRLRVLH